MGARPTRQPLQPEATGAVMVAAGDVRQRLVAGIAARDGFAALMRRQLWRAAE